MCVEGCPRLGRSCRELAKELGQQGSSCGGYRAANSEAGHSESPGEGASGLLRGGFQRTWGLRDWIWIQEGIM